MPAKVTAGTKVYVGPQTTVKPVNQAAWEALTPWTELLNLETIGALGISRQTITFSPIGTLFEETYGGAQQPGSWSLTGAWTPGDPGQDIIAAAVNQNLLYPFKLVFNDRLNLAGKDSTVYIHGQVLSYPIEPGGNSDVIKTTINIGVVAPLLVVAATAGS